LGGEGGLGFCGGGFFFLGRRAGRTKKKGTQPELGAEVSEEKGEGGEEGIAPFARLKARCTSFNQGREGKKSGEWVKIRSN